MQHVVNRRDLVKGAAFGTEALVASNLIVQNAVAQTADGALIYEGEAQGLRGWVTVHVTLSADGGAIEAVDVVRSTEAPHVVCGKAIDAVPGRIVEGQSTDVDGVTGAKVQGPDGPYTITAQKTILACGGIAQSPDMPAQYAPDFVTVRPYTNASCRRCRHRRRRP